jgi:hypothetical protein
MSRAAAALAISSMLAAACGGSSQPGPEGIEVITGSERFGWDQPAADAGELATFRYALYLDGTRSDAADVTCATAAANGRFACTCRMPAMAPGTHTLAVAAFVSDGADVLESSRSTAVRVVKR